VDATEKSEQVGLGREKPPDRYIDCPYCHGIGQVPNLAIFLRTVRKGAELTQKELSIISGYSRTQIQMVERGKRNPSPGLVMSYISLQRSERSEKLSLNWHQQRKTNQ
jgi:DNA-binding XRE family transcriptional regulator